MSGSEIRGLHHVTLVTGNYSVNARFYVDVLGLRRVKLSVNQDDVYHRHAFYANPESTVGSTITFFEWPHLPFGNPGLGSPHHVAYRVVSIESLRDWYWWLRGKGVPVEGPFERFYGFSVYLTDPDGAEIELVAPKEGAPFDYVRELLAERVDVDGVSGSMRLISFDHAAILATDPEVVERFYEKFLGVTSWERTRDRSGRFYLVASDDERGDYLHYVVEPDADYGLVGRGSIHHVAFAVEDERDQRTILRRLISVRIPNSGVVDRFWFKSLYVRDPEGNLLEVATAGPGYAVDEPPESLGTRLVLPPWLEPRRREIEEALTQLDSVNPAKWPPDYPSLPEDPESYPLHLRRPDTFKK
ncbi:MAG: VOC family protein [Thaumarchaeota archaeon]|nr:VOC family protein [Candidatus Calditenuaceae archaeon]MDW8043213.1 VOC family protein [Nitrososphaerota archaeon]